MIKNDNSRAVWNEFLPDLEVIAPEVPEDIFDVILYLGTSVDDPRDRICFHRIKASTLLDTADKKFEI